MIMTRNSQELLSIPADERVALWNHAKFFSFKIKWNVKFVATFYSDLYVCMSVRPPEDFPHVTSLSLSQKNRMIRLRLSWLQPEHNRVQCRSHWWRSNKTWVNGSSRNKFIFLMFWIRQLNYRFLSQIKWGYPIYSYYPFQSEPLLIS